VRDGVTPDVSGRGHDAAVRGEEGLPELVEGIAGRALRFSAAGRHWLEVPASPELDPPTALTVMAWIKPAARNATYEIACHKGDKSGDPPWPGWRLRFFWTRATLQIGTPDGGEFLASSPEWSVQPGRWTHVAGTYDGEKLRVFVNASLAVEVAAPGSIAPQPRPLVLGSYIGRKNAYAMDGLMDDVKLFGRALTEDEILRQATAALPDD